MLIFARRIFRTLLIIFCVAVSSARAQEGSSVDDVRKGRELALLICANCHVVARDQPDKPILRPAAVSFESIAKRQTIGADWVKMFLNSTHRGLDKPEGMPNPGLMDYQAQRITACLLSLRQK